MPWKVNSKQKVSICDGKLIKTSNNSNYVKLSLVDGIGIDSYLANLTKNVWWVDGWEGAVVRITYSNQKWFILKFAFVEERAIKL